MKYLAFFTLFVWAGSALADIGDFVDQEIDLPLLSNELLAVGLTCRIARTDRVVVDGKAVLETSTGVLLTRAVVAGRKVLLDADGDTIKPADARPRTTAPYIRLNCDEMIDVSAAQAVLDAHTVLPMWQDSRKQQARARARELQLLALDEADVVLMASIRDARNTLAGQIDAMSLARLKALDVRAWAGWP